MASQSDFIGRHIHDDEFDTEEIPTMHRVCLLPRMILEFDGIARLDDIAPTELVLSNRYIWKLYRTVL
jgi:hypothetical protein